MEPAGQGLLEREPALDALRAAVAEAAAGRGCAVLLTGEGGIGKTSVIRAFLAKLGAQSRTEAVATAVAKIRGPAADMRGHLRRGDPSSLVELPA